MNPRNDHYTFLGLPVDAPADQVAVAWDRMQRQADAVEARSPAQAEAIRGKLRQIREDLLSGAQRREAYNRRLLSERGTAPQEPTILQPLGLPQSQPQYTTVVREEPARPVAAHAPSNNRWLLPVALLAALLLGVGGAVAGTRLLGGGGHSAVNPTATVAPTSAPTSASTPAPTETSAPPATPTSAPAPTSTLPAPTSPPPTTVPAQNPVTRDSALITAKGYTPAREHAETSNGAGGTLYAWQAVCTGSADGYCQKVFFFDGTRYLGTDTLTDSTAIMSVDAAGPATIAVKYANYLPNDPFCCPSGNPVTITYHWTGQRLIPSGTPPGHKP